ncbi:hypothetical protein D6C99_01715 [Aureobasidium pullulans]|nr:hypothetical protein D6C99_01715 [Aureobasidium pullulans]
MQLSYNTTYYPFASTSVPNDTSFGLLNSSDFVVYDRAQGLPLLGDNPTCEKIVLDPTTNKTTTLLNNYFGFYFNGLEDLFVDSHGDIWFADPDYAWNGNRTDHNPSTPRPNLPFSVLPTGQLWVVEDSLGQPNGIAISPDAKNVYIWDTIAGISGTISPHYPNVHSMPYNQTAKHTVYKYDIVDADTAPALINKRPFYYSQEWVPDGVNVAANGFVVAGVGVGMGVDVIDRTGPLVLQIRTHYIVQNFALGGRASYGNFGWMGQGWDFQG